MLQQHASELNMLPMPCAPAHCSLYTHSAFLRDLVCCAGQGHAGTFGDECNKAWELRHRTFAPEDNQDVEDKDEKSKCWKAGMCLCKNTPTGLSRMRLKTAMEKLMKSWWPKGPSRDEALRGCCVLELHGNAAGGVFAGLGSSDFEITMWLHVGMLYLKPWRPTFLDLGNVEEDEELTWLGVAEGWLHSPWKTLNEVVGSLDLDLAWSLRLRRIVTARTQQSSRVDSHVEVHIGVGMPSHEGAVWLNRKAMPAAPKESNWKLRIEPRAADEDDEAGHSENDGDDNDEQEVDDNMDAPEDQVDHDYEMDDPFLEEEQQPPDDDNAIDEILNLFDLWDKESDLLEDLGHVMDPEDVAAGIVAAEGVVDEDGGSSSCSSTSSSSIDTDALSDAYQSVASADIADCEEPLAAPASPPLAAPVPRGPRGDHLRRWHFDGHEFRYNPKAHNIAVHCKCEHHNVAYECRKTRTLNGKIGGKGRPLGFLAAWLLHGDDYLNGPDHVNLDFQPSRAERKAARQLLKAIPYAADLFALERQPLDSDSEPCFW